MPYEISFSKKFAVTHDDYINPCCWGGDVVVDQLLPEVKRRFHDVQSNQEDWGWFIWFKRHSVSLAIDVFCDDPEKGEFRIHLYAYKRKWLGREVTDAPALEEIKEIVSSRLEAWAGSCRIEEVDRDFLPF